MMALGSSKSSAILRLKNTETLCALAFFLRSYMAALLAHCHRSLMRFTEMYRFVRTVFSATAIPAYPGMNRICSTSFAYFVTSVCVVLSICGSPTASLVPDDIVQHCLSPDGLDQIQSRLDTLDRKRILHLPRQAAILVPLCMVDGFPSILFTLRSANLKKHSGEVRYVAFTRLLLLRSILPSLF